MDMKYVCYMFWITILVVTHSVEGKSDEVHCAEGWKKVHRSCLRFRKDTFLTWKEAETSCASEGAQLMSVSDEQELKQLKKELPRHMKHNDGIQLDWWVGLHYVHPEVTGEDGWKWLDGAFLNYNLLPWAPGEPSNAKTDEDEDCGLLNYQGYAKDNVCSAKKPYICEEVKLTPPPTTLSTTSTTTTTTTTTARPDTTTATVRTKPPVPEPTKPTKKKETEATISPRETTTTTAVNTGTTMTNDTETERTKKPNPNHSTVKPDDRTKKPQTPNPNKPTTKPTTANPNKPTTKPTTAKPPKDYFDGCYAVNYESFCPAVTAFGISWPQTEAGEPAIVKCEKGQVRWKCDKDPVCWRGEPNVKPCTSEAIQDLSNQAENLLEDPEDTDQVISFTEQLAESASNPDTQLSEQDIFQTTKLMGVSAKTKPKNASSAKLVIKNVVKCGSSLVSPDKKSTWSSMTPENKRSIASSLISSMESVSQQMLKAFDSPTVETIQEENMELQLHVVDTSNLDSPFATDLVFESKESDFNIPPAVLKKASSVSPDGLARVVFISYEDIASLLDPNEENDTMDKQVISKVISASLGDNATETSSLAEPVTFAFKTDNRGKLPAWKQQCSFWNFSQGYMGAWSQEGCTLHRYNDTHTTCRCNHMTNFAILMDIHKTKMTSVHATTLSYITYVGIIISIICLFLSFVTFFCLGIGCIRPARDSSEPRGYDLYGDSNTGSSYTANERSVQGERNSIHKNLVFCLFVAEVLFLAGIERTDTKIGCAIIAGFLHFFFLASFSWMFVEGVHILFMLVQVFDAARSRLKYYCLVGYGAPFVIVGVSAAIYHEGYGTEQFCWLTNDRMFIWSFAGPVAFILLVNLMILIYAMSAVCKHSEYVFSREKSSASNLKRHFVSPFARQRRAHMKRHMGWIQGALALEVLLGLTWVFGYFYISAEAIPMAYLFTIFNSLQGLFIFVFHCLMNKKVRKEYERFIDYRRPVSSSTASKSTGSNNMNGTNSYAMTGSRKPSTLTDLSKTRNGSYSA